MALSSCARFPSSLALCSIRDTCVAADTVNTTKTFEPNKVPSKAYGRKTAMLDFSLPAVLTMQPFDLMEDKEQGPLSGLIEQFLAGKRNSIG